eukprot:TRINITY_DN7202_c0_g1_i1.p1 TRINITY_DN7202_c0_g1~~TRINITY_DN7202_c0_g1_i1.p1  ORF type:complete len:698 (+),score=109.31 TRINITY_DN7202_c0_g1_i1:80-2173(+)
MATMQMHGSIPSHSEPLHLDSDEVIQAAAEAEAEDDHSKTVRQLVHHQCIYSFIVMYPEVHRIQTGHYYSSKLCMAFAYVVLVGLMQVFMTYRSGSQILVQNSDFFRTLVHKNKKGPYDWLDIKNEDELMGHADLVGHRLLSEHHYGGMQCCRGMECASSGLRCCSPSEVKQLAYKRMNKKLAEENEKLREQVEKLSRRQLSESFLQKPSGGKKPKSSKDSKDSFSSGESALCEDSLDKLKCDQPSLRYTEVWDKLDLNGDGTWTMDEAKYDLNNLGCKFGVSAEEVFRSVCRGVAGDPVMDNDVDGGESANVTKGALKRSGVSKRDFLDWSALSLICSANDAARCGQLLATGVFDGALKKEGGEDTVKNLDTAMEYCQSMLRTNGKCDKMLPVTYTMYRHRTLAKCGTETYVSGPRYVNPHNNHDVMSTMSVNYEKTSQYEQANSWTHIVFLSMILMIWYLRLLGEVSYLCQLVDFSWNMPVAEDIDPLRIRAILTELQASVCARRLPEFSKNALHHLHEPASIEKEDADSVTGEGGVCFDEISRPHKITCLALVLVRIFITIWLFFAGTVFCTSTFSYANLLVDAISLAFVFELPAFFYMFLIPDGMKKVLELDLKPVSFTTWKRHWLLETIFSQSLAGLTLVPLLVLFVVGHHQYFTVNPALESLNCLCFQTGPRCTAAVHMSRQWWDVYWAKQ